MSNHSSTDKWYCNDRPCEGHPVDAPSAPPRTQVLPPEFYAPVSIERAKISAERYRKLQFNLDGDKPRASIPAHPDDDDLVLSRFIQQAEAAESRADSLATQLEKIKRLCDKGFHCSGIAAKNVVFKMIDSVVRGESDGGTSEAK